MTALEVTSCDGWAKQGIADKTELPVIEVSLCTLYVQGGGEEAWMRSQFAEV